MKDMVDTLPGIERVRGRFLEMLRDRKERIATYILAAWEAETLEDINGNLFKTQAILHQIAGTAGTLGFKEMGHQARTCENNIIAHLDGPNAIVAICPGQLIEAVDTFVLSCDAVLDGASEDQEPSTALI